MKKQYFLILTICLMLVPYYMFAGWDDPDKGYFKTQKNIDKDVSDMSASMATISYGGKLLNFIDYSNGSHSKVIIRKLKNTSSSGIKWLYDEKDKENDIPNLTGLSAYRQWTPTPVVFNNILYLFVVNGSNDNISFSTYNDDDDSWSKPKEVLAPKGFFGTGSMAAVVVDTTLCLIAPGTGKTLSIICTTDTTMKKWTEHITDIETNGEEISAITQTHMVTQADKTKKLETKILLAYINSNKTAIYAEFQFDTLKKHIKVTSNTISSYHDYQSVVLAEGTIKGDTSTGRCVQAFLKLDSKDNGYCRYRIQRYQIKDGTWLKRENNLVEQNYLWADKNLNLTVAKFAVPDLDTHDIKQYMCLIYRGYNDIYHPLQCAWAETDKLVYDGSKDMTEEMTDTLVGLKHKHTQYIGYVEGPPPYYLNNPQPLVDPYTDGNAEDISSLEFTTSSSSSKKHETSYSIKANVKFGAGIFKADLSSSFGQTWDHEYTTTVTNSFEMVAGEEALGYYITLNPTITRAFYKIEDVKGNIVDSTYYFYMYNPVFDTEPVELKDLNPAEPETYLNKPFAPKASHNRGIYFASFDTYGPPASNSWTLQTHEWNSIAVDESESQSNTIKEKIKLNLGLGKMWNIGIESSFEYSLTTTTCTGNEVKSVTRLNKPILPTDLVKINYTTHWLKPSTDPKVNWWLHDGAKDQNTWCVTYEVTQLKYKNSTIYGNDQPGQVANSVIGDADAKVAEKMTTNVTDELLYQAGYNLSQNCPNPFNQATVIKYQIGFENTESKSADQSRLTKLVVYDVSGNVVATLVNEIKSPGSYEVRWDASQVLRGVYFYSLQSGSFKDVKKLILLN